MRESSRRRIQNRTSNLGVEASSATASRRRDFCTFLRLKSGSEHTDNFEAYVNTF